MPAVNSFSCALTGHRVLPENFNRLLLFQQLEELIKTGCNYFFCGMAEGFDLLCLSLLEELKERYSFEIEACIPYEGQENNFREDYRNSYRDLLSRCDYKTVLFSSYQDGCFFARDRYMVDCCDKVFAYCTQKTGGTVYTVRYAQKLKKNVCFFEG